MNERYESCVTGVDGKCTRWSHNHDDDPEPVECEHCCGSGNTKVHVKGATVDAPCTPCGGQGIRERDA